MMHSFKESIIIPVSLYNQYKSLNIKPSQNVLNISSNETNPLIKRQQELVNQKMFNKKPYSVYTTYNNLDTSIENTQVPIKNEKLAIQNMELSIKDILKNIDIAQRPNIKSILEKLLDNNIKWNEQGEVILRNLTLFKSNIIDIMKYLSGTIVYKDKLPYGLKEVWNILEEIGIPKSWIKVKIFKKKETFMPSNYPLEKKEREKIDFILENKMHEFDKSLPTEENVDFGQIKKIKPLFFRKEKEIDEKGAVGGIEPIIKISEKDFSHEKSESEKSESEEYYTDDGDFLFKKDIFDTDLSKSVKKNFDTDLSKSVKKKKLTKKPSKASLKEKPSKAALKEKLANRESYTTLKDIFSYPIRTRKGREIKMPERFSSNWS